MKIKILVDNISKQEELQSEHGFSAYLENSKKILFDTGTSEIIVNNARKLNINFNEIDYILLSHNHYDHTGGLNSLLNLIKNKKLRLIIGQNFFQEKFKRNKDKYKKISLEIINEKFLSENFDVIVVNDFYEITKDIYVLNLRGGQSVLKDHFFIKENSLFYPDNFDEEIILLIKKENELTVLTGCCHTGIEYIIKRTNKIFSEGKIKNIIGGLHLKNIKEEDYQKILELIKENKIRIYAGHCTGDERLIDLAKNLKENFRKLEVGLEIII
ncbi:MAG TPA: MBL fold metallo-hydrolase [bacterium]|nr:MBL fold metallo-hydrolase [bacterium]